MFGRTAQLNEERATRQRAEGTLQERERQMSMLNVDYKNIQHRLQKLEGEYRQEVEKVRTAGLNRLPRTGWCEHADLRAFTGFSLSHWRLL